MPGEAPNKDRTEKDTMEETEEENKTVTESAVEDKSD